MKPITHASQLWFKRLVAIAGLILLLPGLLVGFGLICLTFILTIEGDSEVIGVGLASFTLMVIMVGAGSVAAWHGWRALLGKVSKPLLLPPSWVLAGLFGLVVTMALFITESEFAPGLLFPPLLIVAAAVPPLWAVAWFCQHPPNGLTWRQGSVAFAGGATAGVIVALVLELLFPIIVIALVFDFANIVSPRIEQFLAALAGRNVALAMTSPGFIYIFIQIAIIAPLAEELAKPLITLPLLGRVSQRDAFLIGAMAGAGFAAIENVVYAGFGFDFWAGILVVRAVGGAIHPLGAGLVALGWRDILKNKTGGRRRWLAHFGLAAGMHALWNGGSLLVVTLAGAKFFGELPPELDVLGLSAAGSTLAVLLVLGLIALWFGRSMVQRLNISKIQAGKSTQTEFTWSDRNVAIWAVLGLMAIMPMGITGLQLILH